MYSKHWMAEDGNFWTCFPNAPDEMPQDFPTWREADEYGRELFGSGNYIVEQA